MPAGPFGLLVCRPPPWTSKPYYLRRPPPWFGNRAALSGPQLKACLALSEAATAAFGIRGKIPYKGVMMPPVAVKVATTVPKGAKVHGGLTRDERARRAHEAASASIESLRSILSRKAAVAV